MTKEQEKRNTFTGETKISEQSKVSAKSQKKVSIIFRGSRKFDLHIGRNMITFKGRESKRIPVEWLKHKDWTNVAKYFIVKGV